MKELLKKLINEALLKSDISRDINMIIIETPKDNTKGDYSSNIAMQLAKELGLNPRDLALKITANISDPNIDKIEIAGPGFINFYVLKNYLLENINTVLKQASNYGKSELGKGIKINVEYVSANPTGALHLGHARGASYGDSLTKILSYTGYDVTREYYINDAGNQIANLTKSIQSRYAGFCGRDENMPEDGYHGKEIIKIAEDTFKEYGDSITDVNIFRQKGLDYLLNQIKLDLKNFRVEFDLWSSEQALYDDGSVDKTLKLLKENQYTYEQDGALWLQTTMYGDEKDRVIVKSDQTSTYLLPDIAYHLVKYHRGYDFLIDVLGADHHGYVPRLKAALKIMGEDPDKLSVEILQMVRLVRGNEEVKMSKRTGNAVTINELVDDVGLDAVRYFFAMRSLDTQMDFDLDLASKKTSDNPVYYVQYAHARIHTIISDYKHELKPILNYATINSDYAYNLLAKVYEFKEVVELSATKKAPHIITNYVYDLAGLFHTFYAHEKVLTDDPLSTEERINLINAVAITIKNALTLIGVEAKDKM